MIYNGGADQRFRPGLGQHVSSLTHNVATRNEAAGALEITPQLSQFEIKDASPLVHQRLASSVPDEQVLEQATAGVVDGTASATGSAIDL